MAKPFPINSAIPLLLAVLMAGCSDGPDIARVTGRVTRNGKPVAGATLNFMPDSGRPSWAVTGADGKYELHYTEATKGALVGKHKVFVVFRPADPKEEAEVLAGRLKRPADQAEIMAKYGKWDTTPLEVEVTENGQVVDLQLD